MATAADNSLNPQAPPPELGARRSLLVDAGWAAIGMAGSRVIVLAGMILAARVLGKSLFGQLGMIQQSVMLFSVVISYGLGLTGAKFVAELRLTDRERAGRILIFVLMTGFGLAVLAGGALLAVAPAFSEAVLRERSLGEPLMWSAPWLIFASLSLTIQGCLTGLFAFRAATWVQLIESVLSCVLVTAGAIGAGLPGAALGFGIGSAGGCAVAVWMLNRLVREAGIPLRWNVAAALREGWGLSDFWFPLTLNAVVMASANWICPVFLVRQPGGFAQLALFNAASFWFNALGTLPNLLQRVGMVHQASALGRNDVAGVRAVHGRVVWLNLAMLGTASVPLAAFSRPILGWYGDSFQEGWLAMVLSLATVLSLAVIKPCEQTLQATGGAWLSLGLSSILAGVYIIAGLYLAPWGASGLALARLAAFVIHAGLMVCALRDGIALGRHTGLTATLRQA